MPSVNHVLTRSPNGCGPSVSQPMIISAKAKTE